MIRYYENDVKKTENRAIARFRNKRAKTHRSSYRIKERKINEDGSYILLENFKLRRRI